jgi:hypothetical protein
MSGRTCSTHIDASVQTVYGVSQASSRPGWCSIVTRVPPSSSADQWSKGPSSGIEVSSWTEEQLAEALLARCGPSCPSIAGRPSRGQ